MVEKIKFSIGIPAYKGQFLRDCILSILSQTYSEFDLIIINDFSPDPIDDIVSQFEDIRIKYFKNDSNIGAENVVLNWNNCINKAENEFFILMGDDDLLEYNYLEEFICLINKYPNCDVYHCRTKIIDENSQVIQLTPSCPDFETVYETIWHSINEYRLQYISDFVYRTKTLKKNGGFYQLPLGWGSDNISSYIATGKKGIAYTNIPLLKYRSHSSSISSSGKFELKMKAVLLQQKWILEFMKTKPESATDLILYNDLIKNIKKVFQKRKIYTIAYSLENNFSIFFNIINKRKSYEIAIQEIFYALLIYMKEMRIKKTFIL